MKPRLTRSKVIELINKIVLAKVVGLVKHENADSLWITQLDIGTGENVQVVTAATNIREGDLVPYLAAGEKVPGPYFKDGEEFVLEARKMRGEMSNGMILASDEIGIGEDHDGILILGSGNLGHPIAELLSDQQLQYAYDLADAIEITPEIQEKFDLITQDLEEVIGEEDILEILGERPFRIYLGSATTGKPHLGYFVWVLKMADFLKAGCEVTLLFADLHAYLDNMKSDWDQLEYRVEFYKLVITKMLEIAGVDTKNLRYIKGTDFQLSEKYTLDLYRAAATTSLRDAKKAGAEVVKQVESPQISSILYPLLQALDEEYLQVDAQLGGSDQRKIFTYAREHLPRLGYKKRVHLMTPLIPGLTKTGKMSSSEPNSKVDFDDSQEVVLDKVMKAFSVDKEVEGNGLLAICKYILFKVLTPKGESFKVNREEKWGGDLSYDNYEDLEKDFVNGNLSSVDLKPAVAREVESLIAPIRELLEDNQELIKKAYPEM